jgi:ATP-dependent helicase/nuclease subunit A
MGNGTITIYSASAGSGKTFTLTGIYLSALFRFRYNYRRILAVTFTNKATAEMKSRILENLHKLATGEKSDYLAGLIEEIGRDEMWIRSEAVEILNSILHDYSRFSVSTIDSFFQKILRAFAREAGLYSGFNIELDHTAILSSAVNEMIVSANEDSQLKNWLINYAASNIDEEKSWNLRDGIIKLAEELFKEKFKILSESERANLENKKFLLDYIEKIKAVSSSFEEEMVKSGKQALMIFSAFSLSDDMFYRKGQGIPKFIRSLAGGNVIAPNEWVREIMNDPPRWSTGTMAPQLQDAIADGLENILRETISFYQTNIVAYNSSKAVLSNIYALGILSDVLYNVHKITTSQNSFLLSDAGEVLNLITMGDQSPFIYEKIGNRYENFMIDEFQDTSIIQWNNFKPLIDNSMSEGFDNLVVGDVKQSIYRWRNSDWKILGSVLSSQVDNDRFLSKPLATNWRSRSNIISFNNALFTFIPQMIDQELTDYNLPVNFTELYSEACQSDPGNKPGGYVRLEFIENEEEKTWQQSVLEKLPGVIEAFQDKGYNASDIGIIVRNGKEGSLVLRTLIEYSAGLEKGKEQYNFNVVSNDSLLLSNSHVISFIIALITVVNEPSDMISRAVMLRYYLLAKGDTEADKAPLLSADLIEVSQKYFPDGYTGFLEKVSEMPLFEAIENIIGFFRLGDYSWNVPYLNTFQDYVISFTGSGNSDFRSFLDWWDTTGRKKSVVLPGSQEAMRILTIHKSKGLEFKVVILPFISWELDHMGSKQPVLWVKPSAHPFNELGIVPVRYGKNLSETIFADYFKEEKYSVYLDNINLLYVAMTRAKDAIYGFSDKSPRTDNSIAVILKKAFMNDIVDKKETILSLYKYFNTENQLFEYGVIPENHKELVETATISSKEYHVSQVMDSLKLKLHGENYFSSGDTEIRKKINYGKMMHEVFEGINTRDDISSAIRKLVIEGKLPEDESVDLEKRIKTLISEPAVAEWFLPGNEVMNEAGILLTSGDLRRPDRVIFKDGKTIIIDFKFGEESDRYIEQVELYRRLIADMGYKNTEACIWYVDKNKIVTT